MSATTTNLKEAIVNRRSIRKVTKNATITKERIEEVLKTALRTNFFQYAKWPYGCINGWRA